MEQDTVIKVEGLYKKFSRSIKRNIAYGSIDLARNMLGFPTNYSKLRKGEFWALNNIDFEVKKGEKIGFLGENGSGKSTLLRLINGIFPPDKGKIQVRGNIGALIAVGVGFHPHLSGRENIYLNGIILGMTRKEIDKKLKTIIDFAEIGDFIEAPVSTYSSGMRVKLGFSVAVHTDPDIMLVDEVLSVGDLAFQLKCLKKLSEYRQKGGTFILVSHNMQTIRNTCERVIWLDHGVIKMDGDTNRVCDLYEADQIKKTYSNQEDFSDKIITIDPDCNITKVEIKKNGELTDNFETGDSLEVELHYECKREVKNPIFTVSMTSNDGDVIFENYSNSDGLKIDSVVGSGTVKMFTQAMFLKANIYYVTVTLSEGEQLNKLEWHDKAYKINFTNTKYPINQGLIYPQAQWTL